MTITITLPPAAEEWLRAKAEASGKDMGTLVVEAVEAHPSLAALSLQDILAPVHEDFHKSGLTEAQLDTLLQETLAEVRAEQKSRAYFRPNSRYCGS